MKKHSGKSSSRSRPEQQPAATQPWTAIRSKLQLGRKIASGCNSRVFRGIYAGQEVAVKLMRAPAEGDAADLESHFDAKVALLSRLGHHPNVVRLVAACRERPVYCVITELMPRGTLTAHLREQRQRKPASLLPEDVVRLALDVARGMEHLHSRGVVHRGTYRWMAPEVIRDKRCDRKVDVYSIGLVLWGLTTCVVPFQDLAPVQVAYAVGNENARPPLSPPLASLLGAFKIRSCKRTMFSSVGNRRVHP